MDNARKYELKTYYVYANAHENSDSKLRLLLCSASHWPSIAAYAYGKAGEQRTFACEVIINHGRRSHTHFTTSCVYSDLSDCHASHARTVLCVYGLFCFSVESQKGRKLGGEHHK